MLVCGSLWFLSIENIGEEIAIIVTEFDTICILGNGILFRKDGLGWAFVKWPKKEKNYKKDKFE